MSHQTKTSVMDIEHTSKEGGAVEVENINTTRDMDIPLPATETKLLNKATVAPHPHPSPCALAWQANNIRGQSLRMVASGLQVAFGTIGGINASTVFMEQEIPTYRTGIWAVTGAQLYLIVSTCLLTLYYWRQNKKADRGEIIIEGLERFRYTY